MVLAQHLKKGITISCGCYQVQSRKESIKIAQAGNGVIDDTNIHLVRSALSGKSPKNNTSGVRGVTFSNGRYIATITFRKQHYYLGRYERIEEAALARKKAEEALYGEWLEHYENDLKAELEAEYSDYCNCKYLIITETRRVQEFSDKLRPQHMCGFALPLSKITNILWFKLGMGFGQNSFPINSQVAVKARMILDISIANNANKYFAQAIDDYKQGRINQEMALGRIRILQEKVSGASHIDESNVDELLDFTPEELQKYDDAIRLGKEAVQNKEQIIRGLRESVGEKESIISILSDEGKEKDDKIQEQAETIQTQKEEIEALRKQEQDRVTKKLQRKKNIKNIVIAILVIAAMVCLFFLLQKLPEDSLLRKIGQFVAAIIGFYSGVCTIFPKANVFLRIRERKENTGQIEE